MIRALFFILAYSFVLHATSLDSLVQDVKKSTSSQIQSDKAREKSFLKDFQAAKKKLANTEAQLAEQKRKTQQLKATFEANKEQILKLNKQLDTRSSSLKDLFAIAQQEARDLSSMIKTSMTSADILERPEFLDELSTERNIPSIEDMRKFWEIYLEEIVESGKIKTIQTQEVTIRGEEEPAKVTRIGIFSAFDENGYIRFDDTLQGYVKLIRQPSSSYVDYISSYESATNGSVVPVVVDPTRGVLFSMLKEKATILERIEQAGVIGYIILALGALTLLFAIYKGIVLFSLDTKVKKQLESHNEFGNNPLGRILKSFEKHKHKDISTIENKLESVVLKEIPKIQTGLPMIKLIAAVAPLLGLLGTVTGMIETFQSITLFGTGDPKLMAGGISQALMTTVLGLVVAIPVLFIHNLLHAKSRKIVEILTQQSSALVAQKLEMIESKVDDDR
ncbi:MAG: DUF3450 family protein [Campylobacterota bacterium]|nr:DUF3450 family protein [Campylobacterota bacterium]